MQWNTRSIYAEEMTLQRRRRRLLLRMINWSNIIFSRDKTKACRGYWRLLWLTDRWAQWSPQGTSHARDRTSRTRTDNEEREKEKNSGILNMLESVWFLFLLNRWFKSVEWKMAGRQAEEKKKNKQTLDPHRSSNWYTRWAVVVRSFIFETFQKRLNVRLNEEVGDEIPSN